MHCCVRSIASGYISSLLNDGVGGRVDDYEKTIIVPNSNIS